MTIEERLRRAIDREVETVEPGDNAWDEVQHRLAEHRRHRTVRTAGLGVLAAAAAVVIGLAVASLVGGDAQELTSGPADDDTTTTSAPRETTTTTTPAPPPESELFPGIWPFASQDEIDAYEADPGVGMFFDAESTALEFARAYLGMPDPVAEGGYSAVEGGIWVVDVRPRAGSPFITTVQLGVYGRVWTVEWAQTNNIGVEHPRSGQAIANPVVVTGNSTAYEATVQVEVRQDGQVFGETLGHGFVMGGANAERGPFAGDVTYDPPTRPGGAVIFWTDSAEDGSVQGATVVRVGFDRDQQSAAITRFSVFFHRGDDLVEVGRESGRTAGVLRAALEALVAGPYREDGDGLSSPFSDETADILAGVNLRSDGTAVIDFDREVPNANTSEGSRRLLEQLDATVFQFSTVERIEYRLRGSCEAFWEWLQRGGCPLRQRP